MVAVSHMVTAAAGVAGYAASKKYGSKIPFGNAGKIGAGAILVAGGHFMPDGMVKGAVVGAGVGVALDGLLSYVGL